MNKLQTVFFSAVITCFSIIFSSDAQSKSIQFEDYAGLWKGNVPDYNPFQVNITIADLGNSKASFVLSNDKELIRKEFTLKDTLHIELDKKLYFEGVVNQDKSQINGFIKLGNDFYPTQLQKKNKAYKGILNLSANHFLQPESHYLEIRKVYNSVEGYGAYPLLGAWVDDLRITNNNIYFEEFKTGLIFQGELKESQIILSVGLDSIEFAKINYIKVDKKGKTETIEIEDGWTYAKDKLSLKDLEHDIDQNSLKGVESVLVAQDGKIRYENYFNGSNSTTTNDLRSAGKSIGSAIIGLAIDDEIITSTQEKVYDYLPQSYQYTKDEEKSKITIEHLLTMSSGIGVYENDYQETDDWLKTVLEPKLKYKAGERTNYMSSDPFLLSVNLSERLSYPLEFYMEKKLFGPLGITNYILNTDDKGNPYFAGGLCMTPRDMLKFGQLYLDKGVWNGKRILSEKWINTSFKKHTNLENTSKKNAYGYFWWHDTYTVNGKSISTMEARGNGGQYISIIPELNTVIVVTTENYNKRGAAQQTEKIIEAYVLSTLMEE
ncbi:serine hydrolase domain-containing protein [Winogradskyella flava]|uniref:Serine hydrolase n=1 Tax=Winogradskyella flava TaxID=1884876 RepID=A0A842IN99_9FLAO|nr:serine hydrolase [Winogradskyella flava]MBC2843689.1 serine hydrolase [Winogradskyella flava]